MAAAQGLAPFDLLFTGGTVVDVSTGELRPADVGVVGPLIASVHTPGARDDAAEAFDITGRFLAPGFLDLHVHTESAMLTPGGYAEAVCPRGTTTIFCDPHELANVAGVDGVRYVVDAAKGLPIRFVVQAPSCVPPHPGPRAVRRRPPRPRGRDDALVARGRRPRRGHGHDGRAHPRPPHGRRRGRRHRQRQARQRPRRRAHRPRAAGLPVRRHRERPRDLHRRRRHGEAPLGHDRGVPRDARLPDPADRRRARRPARSCRSTWSPPPTTSSPSPF